MSAQIIKSIVGCARCGGEGHKNLKFKKLKNPVQATQTFQLTHWAMCPETNEPILMAILENQHG